MASSYTANIAGKFGLRSDNFILDPVEDHECFARDDIPIQQIAESLDIDLLTGLAPKRLVWGPYGAGKTHMLMRTMAELSQLTEVCHVRIECPDLGKKSRFHDLYREGIMRGLGQDFVLNLLEGVVREVGFKKPEQLRQELRNWFQDEEIARAAEQLYNPNFDRLKLWRWLSGIAMSRGDLDVLGQTQDLTQAEAARLADILIMLGLLLRKLENKTLVLILDEMERLYTIGAETITTFVSGCTHSVDPNQRYLCVLVGSSAALETEMVDIFSANSPVASRLGSDAKIEVTALSDPDVDAFIERLLVYLRSPDFDVDAAVRNAPRNCLEDITERFFPFSVEAVDALKEKLEMLTPRAITMQMTRALGRAHRKDRDIITSDCIG